MCSALPDGFASPRRFSRAFLEAERKELELYRTDSRRMLRGLNLAEAIDPTTGLELPTRWWSRYRCHPPLPPHKGAAVLVRTTIPPRERRSNDIALLVTPQKTAAPSSAASDIDADSGSVPPTALCIRKATFITLEDECHNRVRFADDSSEHVVHDLDVMLQNPLPPRDPGMASPASSLPNLSPPSNFFSPSPGYPNSSTLFDSKYSPYVPDAPSQLLNLYNSPRPTLISPPRPLEVRSRSETEVEYEVDIQQVAHSLRLLNRKEELLTSLRQLNDEVAQDNFGTASGKVDEVFKKRFDSVKAELTEINAVLYRTHPFDGDFFMQQATPRGSTLGRGEMLTPLRTLKFDTPDAKGTMSRTPVQGQTLAQSHRLLHTPSKPPVPVSTLGMVNPSPRQKRKKEPTPVSITQSLVQTPPLRPEHLAKNVDFRSTGGSVLLARALTRDGIAKLPDDSFVKGAHATVRAKIMECVSSCVAVLVRARSSRDYHSLEELIDAIRTATPGNEQAVSAIYEAAKSFDTRTSSSDSFE